MITVLVFIITLGILVLVHECGHYFAARWFKIGVEEFSIGFPPRIVSWTSPKTAIRYALGWLPLGGYVKIAGEDHATSDTENKLLARWKPQDLFFNRPLYQRIIVLAAGVTMNFLFAWVLFSIIAPLNPQQAVAPDSQDARAKIFITSVADKSLAAELMLVPGSKLLSIDNQTVKNQPELVAALKAVPDNKTFPLTYQNPRGETQTVTAQFKSGAERKLGVGVAVVIERQLAWYQIPGAGLADTWNTLSAMVTGLIDLIRGLFIPGVSTVGEVAGPVGIAALTGQVWRLGFIPYLQFVALLSLNLFLINILPIPALDGGRIAVAIVDTSMGGRWSEQAQNRVHQVGFIFLLGLILILTVKDIIRLVLN